MKQKFKRSMSVVLVVIMLLQCFGVSSSAIAISDKDKYVAEIKTYARDNIGNPYQYYNATAKDIVATYENYLAYDGTSWDLKYNDFVNWAISLKSYNFVAAPVTDAILSAINTDYQFRIVDASINLKEEARDYAKKAKKRLEDACASSTNLDLASYTDTKVEQGVKDFVTMTNLALEKIGNILLDENYSAQNKEVTRTIETVVGYFNAAVENLGVKIEFDAPKTITEVIYKGVDGFSAFTDYLKGYYRNKLIEVYGKDGLSTLGFDNIWETGINNFKTAATFTASRDDVVALFAGYVTGPAFKLYIDKVVANANAKLTELRGKTKVVSINGRSIKILAGPISDELYDYIENIGKAGNISKKKIKANVDIIETTVQNNAKTILKYSNTDVVKALFSITNMETVIVSLSEGLSAELPTGLNMEQANLIAALLLGTTKTDLFSKDPHWTTGIITYTALTTTEIVTLTEHVSNHAIETCPLCQIAPVTITDVATCVKHYQKTSDIGFVTDTVLLYSISDGNWVTNEQLAAHGITRTELVTKTEAPSVIDYTECNGRKIFATETALKIYIEEIPDYAVASNSDVVAHYTYWFLSGTDAGNCERCGDNCPLDASYYENGKLHLANKHLTEEQYNHIIASHTSCGCYTVTDFTTGTDNCAQAVNGYYTIVKGNIGTFSYSDKVCTGIFYTIPAGTTLDSLNNLNIVSALNLEGYVNVTATAIDEFKNAEYEVVTPFDIDIKADYVFTVSETSILYSGTSLIDLFYKAGGQTITIDPNSGLGVNLKLWNEFIYGNKDSLGIASLTDYYALDSEKFGKENVDGYYDLLLEVAVILNKEFFSNIDKYSYTQDEINALRKLIHYYAQMVMPNAESNDHSRNLKGTEQIEIIEEGIDSFKNALNGFKAAPHTPTDSCTAALDIACETIIKIEIIQKLEDIVKYVVEVSDLTEKAKEKFKEDFCVTPSELDYTYLIASLFDLVANQKSYEDYYFLLNSMTSGVRLKADTATDLRAYLPVWFDVNDGEQYGEDFVYIEKITTRSDVAERLWRYDEKGKPVYTNTNIEVTTVKYSLISRSDIATRTDNHESASWSDLTFNSWMLDLDLIKALAQITAPYVTEEYIEAARVTAEYYAAELFKDMFYPTNDVINEYFDNLNKVMYFINGQMVTLIDAQNKFEEDTNKFLNKVKSVAYVKDLWAPTIVGDFWNWATNITDGGYQADVTQILAKTIYVDLLKKFDTIDSKYLELETYTVITTATGISKWEELGIDQKEHLATFTDNEIEYIVVVNSKDERVIYEYKGDFGNTGYGSDVKPIDTSAWKRPGEGLETSTDYVVPNYNYIKYYGKFLPESIGCSYFDTPTDTGFINKVTEHFENWYASQTHSDIHAEIENEFLSELLENYVLGEIRDFFVYLINKNAAEIAGKYTSSDLAPRAVDEYKAYANALIDLVGGFSTDTELYVLAKDIFNIGGSWRYDFETHTNITITDYEALKELINYKGGMFRGDQGNKLYREYVVKAILKPYFNYCIANLASPSSIKTNEEINIVTYTNAKKYFEDQAKVTFTDTNATEKYNKAANALLERISNTNLTTSTDAYAALVKDCMDKLARLYEILVELDTITDVKGYDYITKLKATYINDLGIDNLPKPITTFTDLLTSIKDVEVKIADCKDFIKTEATNKLKEIKTTDTKADVKKIENYVDKVKVAYASFTNLYTNSNLTSGAWNVLKEYCSKTDAKFGALKVDDEGAAAGYFKDTETLRNALAAISAHDTDTDIAGITMSDLAKHAYEVIVGHYASASDIAAAFDDAYNFFTGDFNTNYVNNITFSGTDLKAIYKQAVETVAKAAHDEYEEKVALAKTASYTDFVETIANVFNKLKDYNTLVSNTSLKGDKMKEVFGTFKATAKAQFDAYADTYASLSDIASLNLNGLKLASFTDYVGKIEDADELETLELCTKTDAQRNTVITNIANTLKAFNLDVNVELINIQKIAFKSASDIEGTIDSYKEANAKAAVKELVRVLLNKTAAAATVQSVTDINFTDVYDFINEVYALTSQTDVTPTEFENVKSVIAGNAYRMINGLEIVSASDIISYVKGLTEALDDIASNDYETKYATYSDIREFIKAKNLEAIAFISATNLTYEDMMKAKAKVEANFDQINSASDILVGLYNTLYNYQDKTHDDLLNQWKNAITSLTDFEFKDKDFIKNVGDKIAEISAVFAKVYESVKDYKYAYATYTVTDEGKIIIKFNDYTAPEELNKQAARAKINEIASAISTDASAILMANDSFWKIFDIVNDTHCKVASIVTASDVVKFVVNTMYNTQVIAKYSVKTTVRYTFNGGYTEDITFNDYYNDVNGEVTLPMNHVTTSSRGKVIAVEVTAWDANGKTIGVVDGDFINILYNK